MASCVKDFYIPPLLKTLAGVVFKRRQCRHVMERLESASTTNVLTNAEMVYNFRCAFWCCLGGEGVGGEGGGGNYVTWTCDVTSSPYVDRIRGIWKSSQKIPKAIFYLLEGTILTHMLM